MEVVGIAFSIRAIRQKKDKPLENESYRGAL